MEEIKRLGVVEVFEILCFWCIKKKNNSGKKEWPKRSNEAVAMQCRQLSQMQSFPTNPVRVEGVEA